MSMPNPLPFGTAFKITIVTGTTSSTINTETSHAHGLGVVPKVWIVLGNKSASIYKSKASDATYIYVKASVASVAFEALVVAW